MDRLIIDWGTGYMRLCVRAFFPCTLQVARKIAPLVNRHCTEEDRAELLTELRSMASEYAQKAQEYDAVSKTPDSSLSDSWRKSWKRKSEGQECLQKRTQRIICLIEGRKP